MSLKWKEIELVLAEARPLLEGAVVQKIAQCEQMPGGESFLLHGFHGDRGAFRLWISLFQDKTCLALLPHELKPETAKEPSTFVMVMRKHLLGRTIVGVEQLTHDRMAVLHFSDSKSLLIVLIPRRGNLVLLENWGEPERHAKCLSTFQKISLKPGALYELPAPPAQTPKADIRAELTGLNPGANMQFNARVASLYWDNLSESNFQTSRRAWNQAIKSLRKKMQNAVEKQEKDLEQAREAELFQKRGKALFAKLYELGPQTLPKETSIALEYLEGEASISLSIPLDKSKSYAENAEACFKKAKKYSRAVGEIEQMLQELLAKRNALDEASAALEKTESEEDIEKLMPSFEACGIELPRENAVDKDGKSAAARPFLAVESSEGFMILCGRNQEENRRVTFQESKGNDIWMHVKGVPGAHVVILSQKNKTVPLQTLLEAAQLALYHSKMRDGRKAEVDYTFRKYVRAIKGTLAEVTYTENKALNIESDANLYRKIISRQSN